MAEHVLVSMVGGRSGNSKGVTTVVEDGACNEDGRGGGDHRRKGRR